MNTGAITRGDMMDHEINEFHLNVDTIFLLISTAAFPLNVVL